MKYETIKHNKYNFYVQIDKETNQPVVIYHFDDKKEDLLNRLTILSEPQYFLLPIKEASIMQAFTPSYTMDCSCFDGLVDEATIVSGSSSVKIINHHYAKINIVLAQGQSLFGIRQSSWYNETLGSLYIAKDFQEELHKVYHFGHFPHVFKLNVLKLPEGFNSASEFGATMPLSIDNNYKYDNYTGKLISAKEEPQTE